MDGDVEDAVADLVGELADDFLDRLERGERPDPAEYAARHPEAADLIRGALSALRIRLSSGAEPACDPTCAPVPVVMGDYRIVRELGRGGMGIVYEAEQVSLGRRVALKVLPFATLSDSRLLQRFKNEARAAAALDHPHVVKVHAVGQVGETHFLAMQLIDGRPLSDLIRERRTNGAPSEGMLVVSPDAPTATLAAADSVADRPAVVRASSTPTRGDAAYFRQVATWGVQAAEALEHAHSMGVVHRDVKPGNLLLDRSGNVWVADFGLAKLASSDAGVTASGDVLGTLRYMSPEQAGAKHGLVDARTDVYALGATLYELLTGVPAVDGEDKADILRKIAFEEPVPPRKLDRGLPHDLETVVLKCLAKEPGERYGSAEAVAGDLRRFLSGQPILARPLGAAARSARWVRRNPRVTAVGILLAVLASGLAVTSALFWRQRDRAEGARAAEAAERTRAQEAFQQADAAYHQEARHRQRARLAVDTMYTDVAERLLPTEPGMSGPRREFLLKALAFYEEEAAERPVDPGARLGVAWANKRAGRILWATGDSSRALPFFDRAVGIAEELIAGNPTAPDMRAAQAQFYFERSWVHHALLRLPAARDDRRRALAIYEQLGREFPEDQGYRNSEAHVCGCLGLLETDPVEIERCYRRGLVLAARLARDFPTEPGADGELGHVCLKLGRFLAGRPGREQEAEQLLTRALPLWRASVGGPTVHPENLYHLGLTLVHLGDVRARRDAVDPKATEWFQEARVVFRRLDTDHAGHTFSGHALMGGILRERGRLDEAADCFRESIRFRADDAVAHHGLARVLHAKGDLRGAEAAERKAIQLKPDDGNLHSQLGIFLSEQGNVEGGVAAFREAIRLTPDLVAAHMNLGLGLSLLGERGSAVTAFREAVRCQPKFATAHRELAYALVQADDLTAAVAAFREALRLQPDLTGCQLDLGGVLLKLDDPKGAEAAYREAIRLRVDEAEAHCNLGLLLRDRGAYQEAVASLRRGHELGSRQKEWPHPSAEWVRTAESLVRLEAKLPAVLAGKAQPADVSERFALAEMCQKFKQRPAAAARLYADALALNLGLPGLSNFPAYNAACAAALAGTGQGEDGKTLTDVERARFRQQSREWLAAELAAWRVLSLMAATRPVVVVVLGLWRADPRLAGVRDAQALAKLPETERKAWERLWSEVAGILTT